MCHVISLETVRDELTTVNFEDQAMNQQGELYEAKANLLNLPVEVFLKICSYLDAEFICNSLSKVCIRFESIFADLELWRYWVNSRMKATYPALPHLKVWDDNEPNWIDACVEIDKEYKRWSKVKDTMRHVVIKDVHFASVDTVLLVDGGEVCISGGRDRGLALWKVLSVTPHEECENQTTYVNTKPEVMRHDAHSGWVWDLAADSPNRANLVYSASWDNTVKAWDLTTGLNCVETFKCGMSALSVVTSENVVMAGLYSKKIMAFDVRVGPNAICTYKPHRGPVLALDHYENKIASVSEDKTLAVWDRVAGKVLVSNVTMPSERAYPVCISWSPAALYIGDSKGALHLIDPEELSYNKTHIVWPEPENAKSCKITGCYQSLGSMILCSDHGEIKFFYNSYPPHEYASVKTSTLDVTQPVVVNRRFEAISRGQHISPTSLATLKRRRPPTAAHKPVFNDSPISLFQVRNEDNNKGNKLKRLKKDDDYDLEAH